MRPAAQRDRRMPRVAAAVVFTAIALALAGCRPEPAPAPTHTQTQTQTPTPVATPTTTATAEPAGPDDIALPATCESLYSPGMLQTLQAQLPPLNDPGVTMNSSQIVDALELLSSGIPTLRCSWGQPSELGLATNVSIIEQDKAQQLIVALQGVGFLCDSVDAGTMCSLDRTTIDVDDTEVSLGETHFFRGNGWVSTAWIGHIPDGYADDVAATLWS